MNIMCVHDGHLRTPPLSDTILAGVTRDSLLVIAKELGIPASEEPIAIDDIVQGVSSGSVTELMACGTAAVVVGIRSLTFEDGSKVKFPGACPGRITTALHETLVSIQYGRSTDRHGWVHKVPERTAAPLGQSVGRG